MQTLIEFNENRDTPFYVPSHLEALKHKSEYFDVLDLETKIQRHDNPHYLLQQNKIQRKSFNTDSLTISSLQKILFHKLTFSLISY